MSKKILVHINYPLRSILVQCLQTEGSCVYMCVCMYVHVCEAIVESYHIHYGEYVWNSLLQEGI